MYVVCAHAIIFIPVVNYWILEASELNKLEDNMMGPEMRL